LVGRFKMERQALPGEALTVNTSVITALANDYEYSKIFSRQIEAVGTEGDILVGLSTSGNADNVLLACKSARQKGLQTIAITGASGGKIKHIVDDCICVPSDDTPHIQELTIFVGHVLCEIIEQTLFSTQN